MKNQTFLFSKFWRFGHLFFHSSQFIYLFLLILQAPKQMLWSDRLSIGEFSFADVMWLTFLVISFILIGLLSISTIYYFFTLQISFSKTSLHVNAYNFLGLNLLRAMNNRHYFIGEIPYANIEKMEGGSGINTGNLKIKLNDSKEIDLPIKYLERNSEFTQKFISHLSPKQLGDKLEKVTKIRQLAILKNFFFILTIMSLFILQASVVIGIGDFLRPNIWNEELTGLSVDSISMDDDNSLWVSTSRYKSDAFAWHISSEERDHWKLPKELCNDCYPLSISHDLNGNPRLIKSTENGSIIYSWDGKVWHTSSTDIVFYNSNLNAYNTVLWGKQNENLVYIDFATDKFQQFPPPAEVVVYGLKLLDFKVYMDGSVLARFSEKNKPTMLYKLQNENWELVYSSLEENLRIQFFLDQQGKVWLLEQKSYQGNHDQFTLGFYDIEKQVWVWRDISSSLNTTTRTSIWDVAVDPLNRVWISGTHYIDVDDTFVSFVKVFSWAENEISEIEEYTDRNSNFDTIRNLTITDNGIIWSPEFDLLWIDATTKELPQPLPSWVTTTEDYLDTNMQWIFLVLFLLVAILLFLETKT